MNSEWRINFVGIGIGINKITCNIVKTSLLTTFGFYKYSQLFRMLINHQYKESTVLDSNWKQKTC